MSLFGNCVKTCVTINGVRKMSSIGFIGLGNMGGHMARNLLKKNHKLTVYDINEATVTKVKQHGAMSADNISEVAKNCNVIISMLPTNKHVLDCYLGDGGILTSVKPDTLLIDCSTISPSTSKIVEKDALKVKANFIDGPVSGGVVGAEDGTLTFMVGGTKENFNRAKPILEGMGSRIVHCGEVGLGQAAKICNNMLLGITMLGASEALILGKKLGLDDKTLIDIINTSSGRCWSTEIYNPVPGILPNVPSSKNYEGGFNIQLMAKDLGLAQTSACETGTPVPLGTLSHQFYRTAIANGLGSKDFAVIYQFLSGNAKV